MERPFTIPAHKSRIQIKRQERKREPESISLSIIMGAFNDISTVLFLYFSRIQARLAVGGCVTPAIHLRTTLAFCRHIIAIQIWIVNKMHIEWRERRENGGRKKQMKNGVLCSGFVVDVTNQDVSCRGFSARRLVIRGQNGRFLPRSLYFFFPWPILFLTREKVPI